MSREEQLAQMASRFLGVNLTPEGFAAFAAEIESRLSRKGATIGLEDCRDILASRPDWIKYGTEPQLPGHFTRMRDAAKRMARS